MPHATAMNGPEFLHAVARAEAGNGNDINAEAYELRAMQWAADLQTIDAQARLLQDANDRLASARDALRAP